MMIREYRETDCEAVMALWLKETIAAHQPFVTADYWHESAAMVRDSYLPSAETWVYEQDNQIRGFISILGQQFIGALFVASAVQGCGIGQSLIAHVKTMYSRLLLEVYQLNDNACQFYEKCGFKIISTTQNQDTHAITQIMLWTSQH